MPIKAYYEWYIHRKVYVHRNLLKGEMDMFVAPEFEVVKFNVVDVITTSTNETEDMCPEDDCPNATDWA